jgi:predicted O-linked N-acetylglucosamine transferase (SPINDLY family)
VDLPELVTYSLSDYITKAVELAQSEEGTSKFKKHLSATRNSCVLFDTPLFVARLEEALVEIYEGMDTR